MIWVVASDCVAAARHMKDQGYSRRWGRFGCRGDEGWECVHSQGFGYLQMNDEILFVPGCEVRDDIAERRADAAAFRRLQWLWMREELARILGGLGCHD